MTRHHDRRTTNGTVMLIVAMLLLTIAATASAVGLLEAHAAQQQADLFGGSAPDRVELTRHTLLLSRTWIWVGVVSGFAGAVLLATIVQHRIAYSGTNRW
jgi:negative regulator of sigma E activity